MSSSMDQIEKLIQLFGIEKLHAMLSHQGANLPDSPKPVTESVHQSKVDSVVQEPASNKALEELMSKMCMSLLRIEKDVSNDEETYKMR